MDWDELFSLITLGAVFPYLSAAATGWLSPTRRLPRRKSCGKHDTGADAPE